jgi:hypothetical protein
MIMLRFSAKSGPEIAENRNTIMSGRRRLGSIFRSVRQHWDRVAGRPSPAPGTPRSP